MTDLNDWRLSYPGTVFPFGTLVTGYPLVTQVDVGGVGSTFTDEPHPSTDGVVFGVEKYQGRTLTFEVAVPATAAAAGFQRWHDGLDGQELFAAAWDAQTVRRTPGAVAELANLDRGRMVYGRPRNIKPRLGKVRHGWSELVCDFATVDHRFYSLDVFTTDTAIVPAVANDGFSTPIIFPWTSQPPASIDSSVNNAGLRDTWPVVTIDGPIERPSVELLSPLGDPVWLLRLATDLDAGDQAVIDTRPWSRGAWINGLPATGYVRGTRLNECVIPPGAHELRFSGTDLTGTSGFAVSWRNAYAGL